MTPGRDDGYSRSTGDKCGVFTSLPDGLDVDCVCIQRKTCKCPYDDQDAAEKDDDALL